MKASTQHAIKNIGQKVLNLNDITFNKRLGNLIVRCFEMPYVSYCKPLATKFKNYEENIYIDCQPGYIIWL